MFFETVFEGFKVQSKHSLIYMNIHSFLVLSVIL